MEDAKGAKISDQQMAEFALFAEKRLPAGSMRFVRNPLAERAERAERNSAATHGARCAGTGAGPSRLRAYPAGSPVPAATAIPSTPNETRRSAALGSERRAAGLPGFLCFVQAAARIARVACPDTRKKLFFGAILAPGQERLSLAGLVWNRAPGRLA